MKIALLFGIFPQEYYSEIIDSSKGVIQYAADALQKSIIEGLGSLNKEIEIINLPYLGSYPKRYTHFYSPKGTFKYVTQNENSIEGENIKFCNLCGIKMYSRYQKARQALSKWCDKYHNENKIIIVYAIHLPFIKACVDIKRRKSSSLKILLIVPDLPEYMSGKSSALLNLLQRKNQEILNDLYNDIDAYVLLSKYMTERLPIENKPWDVVEGIFNNVADDAQIDKSISTVKTVFYSGTLEKRYGIMNLMEAFNILPDIDFRLVICGTGDAQAEIEEYALKDPRISYRGQLTRSEVLKLQRSANLLINPRTPEGEFTKFSFPSKTMEYLASGVPTLLYKLSGIPEEYFNYCFSLEDLSITALSSKISEILHTDITTLNETGVKARNFILVNKNPIEQSKKIINLINSLK